MARRRRSRNPGRFDHLAGPAGERAAELAIMAAAGAAPEVAGYLGAPRMPVALALLAGGWFLNGRSFKGHTFPAAVAKGAILGTVYSVVHNFRASLKANAGKLDPADIVAAKNPDLSGVGCG